MLSNNFAFYSGKIITELIGDILYFPLWWYTKGFLNVLQSSLDFLKNKEKGVGLILWIKNIFKPMYGQTDWQGKLISFFMRVANIIVRGIIMLFWAGISIVYVMLWIFLPFLAFFEIIFQLF